MGDELGVALRRRITRQLLIGVPLVCGLALFAAKGPAWLVAHGEKATDQCLETASRSHGDPAGCTLGAGFAFGRLFPEEREHARVIDREVRRRRALDAFDAVTANNPTAAQRDAAVARLIVDDPELGDAVAWAAREGAFAPIAAVDLGTSSIDDRLEPAFAALAVGDVAAARKAIAHGEPGGFDGGAQSGALACLLGDRTRGLALLKAAAVRRERSNGNPDAAVRVASQHCGGTIETLGFDPYVVPSFHDPDAVVARLYDPKVQVGRRAAIGKVLVAGSSIFRMPKIAGMALAASGTDEPSAAVLLQTIGSPYQHDLSLGEAFAATPWSVSPDADDPFVDYVPPAWLELAATRYAHAAASAPDHLDADALQISTDAAEHPRDVLRAAAELAYQFAAGYRLRAGEVSAARPALDQWRALDPSDARRAPLEIAAGDPAAALATLDAWQAGHRGGDDGDVQGFVGVNRAFALAATGRFAEAFAAAKPLRGASADWLKLATAIASGAPLESLTGESGEKGTASPGVLLLAIERKQRIADVGYLDESARPMLPAVMVVVAHAASVAGQDPEVVLDKTFAREMPSRIVARARAEAARWRHDAVAAKLWDDRAAAIEHLLVDDHAVVLAGIAGLW